VRSAAGRSSRSSYALAAFRPLDVIHIADRAVRENDSVERRHIFLRSKTLNWGETLGGSMKFRAEAQSQRLCGQKEPKPKLTDEARFSSDEPL
jgi:hypothetical protein